MRSLNDSVIKMSSKDVVVTHLSFLIDTMIRIGTLATTECTLVCLYHIRYNASANQMKSFPHNKGQRHEDGLLTNGYVQRLYFAQYSSLVFFAVVIQRRLEMERKGKRIFIPSMMKSMTNCYYLCKESSRCR